MQTISLIEHLYLIHFPPPDYVEGGKRKMSYSEQVMKAGDCISGKLSYQPHTTNGKQNQYRLRSGILQRAA